MREISVSRDVSTATSTTSPRVRTPARRRTAVRRSGVASAGTPLIPGHGTVRRQDHDPHHPRGDTREDPTQSPETDARRRPSRDDHRRQQRPGPDRSARHARRGWHLAGGRARRGRLRRPRQPDAGLRPLGQDLGRPGDGQRLRHDLSHARSGRAGHRGAARQHARRGAGGRRGRQVRAARQARHVHQPPGLRRGRLLQDRQRPEPADGVDRGRRHGARRAGCGGRPRLTRVDRVRLAIVGCGNICQLNAPGYLEHPRCDVVALCDTEWARAELRARQWGITPRIYKDYAELLDASTVDAVELLTPTYLHAAQIIAALAAGKHVSCQKPIAISVAEADRIAEAVSKARTTFRVTENFLYYPPIVKAKELLEAGAIGEPSLVRIHTTRARESVGATLTLDPEALIWPRDPGRNPGGVLYDDGVHKYATAMYWIGEIGEISAIVGRGEDFIQETPSVAHFRFKHRDCLGIIDYTYAPEMPMRSRYYRADEFFEIHGSRGILWVTRCTGEMPDLPPVMLT